MSSSAPFLKRTKDGTLIMLHVQPRASRDKISGIHGDRLKILVQAPPVDSKANKACQGLLSKRLKIPKSRLVLKTGASSRQKSFLVLGLRPEEILSKLKY